MGMFALIYQGLNNPNLGKTNSNKLSSQDLNKYDLKNQIKTELKSGNTADLVNLTNKVDVDEAAKKFNELNKGDQNKLIGNLLNDAYKSLTEQFNKMNNSTNSGFTLAGFTLGQQENRGLVITKNPNNDPTIKMKEIGDAVSNVGTATKTGSGISILGSGNDTENAEESTRSDKGGQEVISLTKPSTKAEGIKNGTLQSAVSVISLDDLDISEEDFKIILEMTKYNPLRTKEEFKRYEKALKDMREIGEIVKNVGTATKTGSGISIGNDTKESNVGTAGTETSTTIVSQEVTDLQTKQTDLQTKHMRKFNFNNRAFSR